MASIIISKLPKEIQEVVFQRQAQAGNRPNEDLRVDDSSDKGNFAWINTPEGMDFWSDISRGKYEIFYERYPKETAVVATLSTPVDYPLY